VEKLNFTQAEIDINDEYIKKIDNEIKELKKRKAKYQRKNKELSK